jgi:hypothetical protein
MLDALVGVLVSLLVLTGVLIMIGPNLRRTVGRLRSIQRPAKVPSPFQALSRREAGPAGLNAKTQRVLVGAGKLAVWLRSTGHEELGREVRSAAARMTGNEASGLYALQAVIRKVRALTPVDGKEQEGLRALTNELRVAVQDRFEQLELLPFRRP